MSAANGLESWQLEPISVEPKLGNDNYSIWSFKIEVILKSRGLWDLVDSTEVAPKEGSAALKLWKMRDACAQLQFLANIEDRWVRVLKRTMTAREVWATLREQFGPPPFNNNVATPRISYISSDPNRKALTLNPENGSYNPNTRVLPDGWIARYDASYRAWYYLDTRSNPPHSTWEHPLGPPQPSPSTSPATSPN